MLTGACILSEPIFGRNPQAREEDEGLLLSVGSHERGENAKLFIVDANELQLLQEEKMIKKKRPEAMS